MADMNRVTDQIDCLGPMLKVHLFALTIALFAVIFPPLLIVPAGLLVASAVLMTMAGWKELGSGYAIRHLLLLVLLTPVFFIGPIAVPLLVWSDLTKRRQAMDEQLEPSVPAEAS